MTDHLITFGGAINRLIAGEDLSMAEANRSFNEILNNTQPEIHQGAFLSAITAKGPTPKEIAGAWKAIFDLDTVKVSLDTNIPVTDNCGTGMDTFKTFNISTGSAIVAAAGDIPMARHGARAITSKCGTVDLCEALGIDVECDVEIVKESIEKTGIGIFNGMSAGTHPTALFRILSQMRFGSILNIAASLANPANPRYGVRGVYAKEMLMPVTETMREIGFKKALIFHGETGNGAGGMDELSAFAESHIAELSEDGTIKRYALAPEDLGLTKQHDLSEIAAGNDPVQEARRLLRVFSGLDNNGLYNTICLNAAPMFYVTGEAASLKEGVEKAKTQIDSGKAMDKLKDWVQVQQRDPEAGKKQLNALINDISVN
ncbi:MAG: anthranilate phosphoribosyltransferase [Desulfobacterales bacterium]|nr:anthranilate phosphoribosyltransferase [Desulfobacterales bacterium]